MNTVLWALATCFCSPILFVAQRRKNALPRKILVITFGKLGDVVCVTPLIRALKEQCPEAAIHVLCREGSNIVLAGNPFIEHIHTSRMNADRKTLLKNFHREHFDWVINSMPDAFASMVGIWSGAPVRINTISSVHGILVRLLAVSSTKNLRYGFHQSTFAHYMKILTTLGLQPIPYILDTFWSKSDEKKVTEWMKSNDLHTHHFVILNPTAGNAVKEWPTEKWSDLTNRISAELHLPVVLSTRDSAIVTTIRGGVKNSTKVIDASSLSLQEIAALSSKARAFVSVDTGPLYVAYAAGAPIVAIVGPVDPAEQLPPPNERVIHVPPPAGCAPWVFIARTPRTGTPDQLRASRDTSVESVWQALVTLLSQPESHSRSTP